MTDNIAQKWAVYESNVQQYRVVSVTVQSFFLAVGSIWFSQTATPKALLVALFVLGVGHIFYVWMPITFARIRIVDYYKGQLDLSAEQKEQLAKLCTEDQFRSDAKMRNDVVTQFFPAKLQTTVRSTRFKLDVIVPCSYAVIWALMLYFKFTP
jgi:hypothetical protein